MHNKILTTDNMLKKNWDCNQTCTLCLCLPETTDHLLAKCNFVEAVWNIIASFFQLPNFDTMKTPDNYSDCFTLLISSGSKKEKRAKLGILFTFWWQIWKERNGRIFQGEEHPVSRVTALIHDQIQALALARGEPPNRLLMLMVVVCVELMM
jgi:hypothetical protein